MVYPGAFRTGDSPNSDPRRAAVSQVILHHTASTGDVEDIWNMFMQRNSRSVSANFLIAQDGRIFECVNPDTRRAWTTGSGPGGTISPDHSAITLECMDSTGAPEWGQSEASQEAIAKVLAWSAHRYNFPLTRGVTVRGHNEMPGQESTACPGGMPIDSIIYRANVIFREGDDDGFNDLDRYAHQILLGSQTRVELSTWEISNYAKDVRTKVEQAAGTLSGISADLNKIT